MVHALSPKRRRHTGRRGGQPLMPHERDEVAQGSTTPTPPPEAHRAFQDARRGLVDTDKGPVLDHTYRKLRTTGGSSGN